MSVQQPQPGKARGPRHARVRGITVRGVVLGLATALIAVGVAQLVAAYTSFQIGGPVDAVGELSINHVPPAIKNFAIREFGTSDKTVLVWGIYCVLFIFAAFIGVLALRKLWYGLVCLAVFTAIGIYAAESLPTATPRDVLPALIGGAVGGLFLLRVSGLARRSIAPRSLGPPETPVDSSAVAAPPEAPGAPAVPGWKAWTPEPVSDRPVIEPRPDRRRFLLASAGAGVAGLAAYGAGSWLAHNRNVTAAAQNLRLPRATVPAPPLPNGYDLRIPGLSPFITPNGSFYRVDTAIVLPEILPSSWQLRIHGMVTRELTLSFADLIKRPLIEDFITLCCVSNWVGGPYIGNAKWLGASLRSLLQEAGIKAGADQLLCTSADGFTSGTPVQTAMDGRDALLAVAMNGTALPVAHGFPARLVIPGLYGYVSACKWITDIEVTTYGANTSYWAQRGWSAQAPVKTESRIDVPGSGATIKAGQRTAIAGVAWAQHKGIEAVEVKIGDGPWLEAQLSAVPDIDTWRQWVYYWDANVPHGNYVIQARATDKTGYTQTSLQEPPEPNGASGYPSVQVAVAA